MNESLLMHFGVDEAELYMLFTEATWPSLSMNLTTFRNDFLNGAIRDLCPLGPHDNPDDDVALQRAVGKLFRLLSLNQNWHLHFADVLHGFAVLQLGTKKGVASERVCRYLFAYFDADRRGKLTTDQLMQLFSHCLFDKHAGDANDCEKLAAEAALLTDSLLANRKTKKSDPLGMDEFMNNRKQFLRDCNFGLRKTFKDLLTDRKCPCFFPLENFYF